MNLSFGEDKGRGRAPLRVHVPRSDLKLVIVALISGALFFSSAHRLWPMMNVVTSPPPTGDQSVARLIVDEKALDYLERNFPPNNYTVAGWEISTKVAGDSRSYTSSPFEWQMHLEDDDVSPVADYVLLSGETVGMEIIRREHRTDTTFTFRETMPDSSLLEIESVWTVSDSGLVAVKSAILVPPAAEREARVRKAPRDLLTAIGWTFVSIGALIAFGVFLTGDRSALRRSALLATFVIAGFMASNVLQTHFYFENWDPLTPKAFSYIRTFLLAFAGQLWVGVLLFVVIVAGESVNPERGRALWLFFRGRWTEPGVPIASFRGFLVGMICGGVMVAAVELLKLIADARVSLQPRGFFLYVLNSANPSMTLILFFFFIACLEELGYRYFGSGWIFSRTRNQWLAILIPAAIYGLAHTPFTFLPPEDPFWGRAVVMTLVGAVWGWAFLRYDALTVVLSHYTADLFIFSWPRIASGDPILIAKSLAVMSVPLLPALVGIFRYTRQRD